jgi:hypothetical protein
VSFERKSCCWVGNKERMGGEAVKNKHMLAHYCKTQVHCYSKINLLFFIGNTKSF